VHCDGCSTRATPFVVGFRGTTSRRALASVLEKEGLREPVIRHDPLIRLWDRDRIWRIGVKEPPMPRLLPEFIESSTWTCPSKFTHHAALISPRFCDAIRLAAESRSCRISGGKWAVLIMELLLPGVFLHSPLVPRSKLSARACEPSCPFS
jgi:hypothetical protein